MNMQLCLFRSIHLQWPRKATQHFDHDSQCPAWVLLNTNQECDHLYQLAQLKRMPSKKLWPNSNLKSLPQDARTYMCNSRSSAHFKIDPVSQICAVLSNITHWLNTEYNAGVKAVQIYFDISWHLNCRTVTCAFYNVHQNIAQVLPLTLQPLGSWWWSHIRKQENEW
jgi:hypothetical protein